VRAIAYASMLLAICWLLIGSAQAQLFRAGVSRITVGGDTPFDVLVWYPTQAQKVPWQAGPFQIVGSRDAAIASGRFPIVLLSHGGGAGEARRSCFES
jgi:predicted dienelactone hydrolase